ncbi:phosphatase PAP2 family protein [Mobilicoccus pelagius]|nr:phosphatase PAP2 family protein [Mobilicoccus pelagius]
MTVPQAADAARRARIPAHVTFFLVVAALLAVAAFATHSAVEVYEAVAAGDGIEAIDQPVLHAAVDARGPGWTDVAVALTGMAGRIGTPLLGVVALVLFTWHRRDWTPTVLLLTGLLGSLCLTVVGKRITDRVRPPREFMLPPYETSPSFPSGHTLNTTVLAVLVAYLAVITARHVIARWATIGLCTADPMCVGLSRVYLGAHWATDVLAGLLVGAAWACSVVLAHRIWVQVRHREKHAVDPAGPHEGGPGATAVTTTP